MFSQSTCLPKVVIAPLGIYYTAREYPLLAGNLIVTVGAVLLLSPNMVPLPVGQSHILIETKRGPIFSLFVKTDQRCERDGPGIPKTPSIYPAVQNMLLAARALGLGATLTTLYLQFEKEAEAAFGLPPNVHSYALLPMGYPMGRFGPVRRVPLADVVYKDRWGQPSRDL
jgi:nitroreductase